MNNYAQGWAAAAVLSCTLLLLTWYVGEAEEKLVFLDVGQGDAILLQDGAQQLLIDGGAGTQVLTRLGEELPWFDRTIEVVISTHPDKDHLGGLLHVLERFKVGLVLLPRVAHSSQLYEEWLTRLQHASEANHVPYRFTWQGQRLEMGDVAIHVLGPNAETMALTQSGKTNNASVLTRVDFRHLSFLLTGDAEAAVERQLVQTVDPSRVDVHVLKAGHHGSKTSTSTDLLSATSPDAVVISVGKDNRYGHPHPSVLQRLSPLPVLRTDEWGSVQFQFLRDRWFLR